MPRRAPRPCRSPGCTATTRDGSYCKEHRRERTRAYDQRRGTAAQRGYDARWRKVRRIYLAEHPLCADCLAQQRTTAAKEVHHIIKRADGGADIESNLMGLCKPCHSKRTAAGE